ncbi:MAG TPA: DNA repair protein RadC [Bacteroidales bacterium]|nr:DNA repair protein RadC [Bacteroidales bacterium]
MPLIHKSNSIRYWAEDDKPREKMIAKGALAMSTVELITLIIGSGSKNKSAFEIAKALLADNNNSLIKLSTLNHNDLMRYEGIGIAKAINIIAAIEIGKRYLNEKASKPLTIKNSKQVFEYIYPYLAGKTSEEFWILLLNRANRIINKYLISVGGFTGAIVDIKKIFKIAIENRAESIILCHNHPSGNLIASEADINLTQKLKKGAEYLDLKIIDHLIIGDNSYKSFADEGVL